MWTVFKVFIEFVIVLLLLYVLGFWPRGMWYLSSQTRDRTHTLCIRRRSLNHWTAREVPSSDILRGTEPHTSPLPDICQAQGAHTLL